MSKRRTSDRRHPGRHPRHVGGRPGAARRVASIVKDLRTFHKVDAVPSEHDLNEAVASVVRLARLKMQDQATIECNFGDLPKCWIDAGALARCC